MVSAKNDHAVCGLTADRLKTWHHLRDFTPIRLARRWLAPMMMQVNMEDSLPLKTPVINGMHRARDGLAVDARTDVGIVDVMIVGNGMIAR